MSETEIIKQEEKWKKEVKMESREESEHLNFYLDFTASKCFNLEKWETSLLACLFLSFYSSLSQSIWNLQGFLSEDIWKPRFTVFCNTSFQ